MKQLNVIIPVSITLLILLTISYVAQHPESLKPVEQSGPVVRFYKIDELRFEIEVLEIDRQFKIRPDDVIQKELDIANAQLVNLLK